MPTRFECLLAQILEPVLQSPEQRQYATSQRKIVLALSGGMDSRVLLNLLANLDLSVPIAVEAVHVHHGLSVNADSWAEQCKHWCDELNITLTIERVVLDNSAGESLEKLAREARYNALASHLNPGDILLTGQHADDQVETFLLALKRGSGPKGLSSMAQVMPFHFSTLVRPLLAVTRNEIQTYALSQKLQWVEDESNQDVRFDRNYIRHQVTPSLTERWPSFYQSVQRSANLCAQQEKLLNELLEDKLREALAEGNSLSIAPLREMSDVARNHLLRMWLHRQNLAMPSQVQLHHLWSQVAMAKVDANPKLQLKAHEIRRFDDRLFCIGQHGDVSGWASSFALDQHLLLPDNLGHLYIQTKALSANTNMGLSRCTLQGELSVIFEPQGLQACPVGRSGQKKLKKWFQEFGVPSWLRRRTPILLHGSQVVAVAGLFVDSNFSGEDCELIWSKPSETVPECRE